MVARVSTFGFSNTLQKGMLRVQNQYAQVNLQINSGFKSESYMGLASETQILTNMKSNMERYKVQIETGERVSTRLKSMYNSMETMLGLADQFVKKLAQAMGGNLSDPQDTLNNAISIQENFAAQVNVQVAGRYLFAGSMIDTLPVDLSDPAIIPQTTPSVADTAYYKGDGVILNGQIADNHVMNYGVTGDFGGFEKMFRALNLVINNPADIPSIQEAHTLVTQAITEISAAQADVSQKAAGIEMQIIQNKNDQNFLKDQIALITETDLSEAMIRQTNYEAQLEASYSSMVRLMRLNLHSYL